MRIALITGNYYPKASQNGVIAHNLAKEFFKQNHDVKVICFDKGDTDDRDFDIYRLATPHRKLLNHFNKRDYKIGKKFISVYRSLYKFITSKDADHWYERKVYKELEKIESKSKIDLVISLNSPIEAHKAAIHFKNQYNTTTVLYWLDQYTDVSSYHTFKRNKNKIYQENLNMEKYLHDRADLNLIPYTRESWVKDQLDLENYKVVHFPLTENIKNESYKVIKEKIIYSGAFYKENRNPEKLLQMFKQKKINGQLHLFWFGDCQNIIRNFERSENIINHNKVEKNILEEHLKDANFLLNLGNRNRTQLPSKLYTYMNYGKPIINIYYDDDYQHVLEDYEHYISINYEMLNTEEEINKLNSFISKYSGKDLSSSQLKNLNFKSTPKYLSNFVLKEVNYE